MLKISASNFGPIIEGTVELKPLTVFVGPNNSGKSYMAMLIYSLLNQFPRPPKSVRRRPGLRSRSALFEELFEQQGALEDEVDSWAGHLFKGTEQTVRVVYKNLPEVLKHEIETSINELIDGYVSSSTEYLGRYFGASVSELQRRAIEREPLQIALTQTKPHWRLGLISESEKLISSERNFDMSDTVTPVGRKMLSVPLEIQPTLFGEQFEDGIRAYFLSEFLERIFDKLLSKLFEQGERTVHYLPAARTGILQGHKLLASMVIRTASRVGVEHLEFTTLPGVVSDFISELLIMEPRNSSGTGGMSKELLAVAEHLETAILRGKIDLRSSELPYPEIRYRSSAGDLPLVRTSSMVSEMAPIVLWLKHVVNPGDLLILEEPESHLHPASQRRLAEAFAMLVRSGVQVLITTHSDYLLSQLSNLIRLGTLDEERRNEFGYGEDTYLKADDVSAYWFDYSSEMGGANVRELPITVEDGIPEVAFTEFVEKLYNESVELQDLTSNRR